MFSGRVVLVLLLPATWGVERNRVAVLRHATIRKHFRTDLQNCGFFYFFLYWTLSVSVSMDFVNGFIETINVLKIFFYSNFNSGNSSLFLRTIK